MLLLLEPGGRNGRWQEDGLYHQLALRGFAVCAMDVRGIGDMTPEASRGAFDYARGHANEENYAWASLIFGKPLVGQRVTDILAMAAGLRAHPDLGGAKVKVAALDKMTVPALFAASLDPEISEINLAGGLVSYRSVVETERYSAAFANFVFDMLSHTDLPEVAASLAPRRLVLAGTVDGAASTMPVAAVRTVYSGAHIALKDEANWDLESLSAN